MFHDAFWWVEHKPEKWKKNSKRSIYSFKKSQCIIKI